MPLQTEPAGQPLKVAWFSFFPVEWLPGLPEELRGVPKQHPATWQRVLCEEFRHDRSLELHIFSLRKEYPRRFSFSRGNTTFHCLKTPGRLRSPSFYWVDAFLLRKALAPIRPRLCHAWGSEYGSGITASRLPYPWLLTMQGILTWLKEAVPLRGQLRVSLRLEPPALRRAKVATAESKFAADYLKARYPHLDLLQIEHAPSPLFFSVERRPETAPPRLLCVSTFIQGKGAGVLLRALDRLRAGQEFSLTWIGVQPEPFRSEMKAAVSSELWRRITFRDHVPSSEIAAELGKAALFLYPTRADNSPNGVKEAVAAGVPVVASRVGGIPDYVVEGKNGCLFTPGSAEDCLRGLKEAFQHPLFRAGRVEPATHEWAREYLSPHKMAEAFRRAYERVLA